jgi:hypothetical protein
MIGVEPFRCPNDDEVGRFSTPPRARCVVCSGYSVTILDQGGRSPEPTDGAAAKA